MKYFSCLLFLVILLNRPNVIQATNVLFLLFGPVLLPEAKDCDCVQQHMIHNAKTPIQQMAPETQRFKFVFSQEKK